MTETYSHNSSQRQIERIVHKPTNDQHDYTYILLTGVMAILAVSIFWLAISYKITDFRDAMKEEAKQTRLEINSMKDAIKQDLMIELGLVQRKLNSTINTPEIQKTIP